MSPIRSCPGAYELIAETLIATPLDSIKSKMALNVFAGLFIGSSFWNAGGQTSTASLQNKTFGELSSACGRAPFHRD